LTGCLVYVYYFILPYSYRVWPLEERIYFFSESISSYIFLRTKISIDREFTKKKRRHISWKRTFFSSSSLLFVEDYFRTKREKSKKKESIHYDQIVVKS